MASDGSRHANAGWSQTWDIRWDGECDIGADRIGQVLSRVQLPLSNAEYALEQYLLSNGQRLDTETRALLAGVRDCIGRVAVSARTLSVGGEDGEGAIDQHAA